MSKVLLLQGKPVFWKENEVQRIGNLMVAEIPNKRGIITLNIGLQSDKSMILRGDLVLVQHSVSLVYEFIEWKKLYNYYGDKTPEGMEPEHVWETRKSVHELSELLIGLECAGSDEVPTVEYVKE